MRPVTIVGGGLAGLALGSALARAGAKVVLHEAGRLPRPRVCGEFISGLKPEVVARLGLEQHLRGAAVNRSTSWHAQGRLCWEAELPEPALGLSRPALEERLLRDFQNSGGEIKLNDRAQNSESEGMVWAAGRRPDAASPWIGLKIHCRNFPATHDLEMHLGSGGYVGTARIEGGRVNICGLFRARTEVRASREKLLAAYLAACGLCTLAERVDAGEPEAESAAAVSGLDFTRTWREQRRLSLGDHYAPIPPFTGHGMAMALESAHCAFEPMLDYVHGRRHWAETVRAVQQELYAREDSRLWWGRALHPWLLHPIRQKILLAAARAGVLPFQFFYRATHGRANGIQFPSPIFPSSPCSSTPSPTSSPRNA